MFIYNYILLFAIIQVLSAKGNNIEFFNHNTQRIEFRYGCRAYLDLWDGLLQIGLILIDSIVLFIFIFKLLHQLPNDRFNLKTEMKDFLRCKNSLRLNLGTIFNYRHFGSRRHSSNSINNDTNINQTNASIHNISNVKSEHKNNDENESKEMENDHFGKSDDEHTTRIVRIQYSSSKDNNCILHRSWYCNFCLNLSLASTRMSSCNRTIDFVKQINNNINSKQEMISKRKNIHYVCWNCFRCNMIVKHAYNKLICCFPCVFTTIHPHVMFYHTNKYIIVFLFNEQCI